MKWILGLVTWLAVSNLAQPQAEAPAELVFYREKEFLGNSFFLHINGHKMADWSPGRYFRVLVAPGKYHLSTVVPQAERDAQGSPQLLDLEVQAGQVYYLKAYQVVDIFTNELHLKLVDAGKAQREMKGLKLDKDAKTAF
jgi:hypothetical protein